MNKFFIALYDLFESRRALLYALLGVLVVAMASAALRLRFSENITGFFRHRMEVNRNAYLKRFPINQYVDFVVNSQNIAWN